VICAWKIQVNRMTQTQSQISNHKSQPLHNDVFTFQPLELLIVLFACLALVSGLSFLILRRRDEILQDFLTPDEPDIEQEFFKRKPVEEPAEPEEVHAEETITKDEPPPDIGWGVTEQ
jgi:hypothetical protein